MGKHFPRDDGNYDFPTILRYISFQEKKYGIGTHEKKEKNSTCYRNMKLSIMR